MASRKRRSRRHGRVIKVTKRSLRKRHSGARYACKHPKSRKITYHRTKSAANRSCGKSRRKSR